MTIMIAGEPVLVDIEGEAQAWIDRFMPGAELFSSPMSCFDNYLANSKSGWGHYFSSSLPALPEIKIGQIQWPCVGVSRYARGLFLVDRVALFGILQNACGVAAPSDYPFVIPDNWAQTRNRAVTVRLAPDFAIYMFLLTPIRISDDLWLLPLVDGRYFRLGQCKKVTEVYEAAPIATWEEYFSGVATYNYLIDYMTEDFGSSSEESETPYGHPDPMFREPQIPLPFAIDAACFSVGCRPVVPFGTVEEELESAAILKVQCELPENAAVKKATLLVEAKITGGRSGLSRAPKTLRMSTRFVESYFSGNNRAFSHDSTIGSGNQGVTLYSKAVWNVLDQSTDAGDEFIAYSDVISDKLNEWNIEEYYVTILDILQLEPNGFDDYIIYEISGDKKSTTVRSLPIDFVPAYFLAQSPAGDEGAEVETLWFHTRHQTISAKVIDEIAAGGVASGSRTAVFGSAQIADISLKLPGGGTLSYAQAVVNVLNAQTELIAAGSIVYLTWVDDVVAGSAWEGWAITSMEACHEILEKFVMLSNWNDSGIAVARFTRIESSVSDLVGFVEDPLGIFADQIGVGNSGLATRTCNGRHFVIQAACDQEPDVPSAPLGSCSFSGPDGDPQCAITSEADCNAIPGTWTLGGTCP